MDVLKKEIKNIDPELPKYEFDNLIEDPERIKDFLKGLRESCFIYRTKVLRIISESKSQCWERCKKLEKSSETIVQLTNKKLELIESLEVVKLEQKVVEKKTINTIKEIDLIKSEIEQNKEKKETLSLEIVDLEQEIEKSRDHMKKQWEAVKKACSRFKSILDIHIDTEMIDRVEQVTVTFFWIENPTDKKFFVVLMYQDECWKVKKIEPELSMEEKYQLNHVVQFSKQSEVSNVTLLLCELRKLFFKNYFENQS